MKSQQKSNVNRNERMSAILQQLLGPIIQPFLESTNGLVSISKVDVSKDLKWAKVWLSIINAEDDLVLSILKNNIYEIQGEVNHHLNTKILPRISFQVDTSARYAAHIDELIKKTHEE